MVFPTLDLKILTSLTYPENTAVLNWMTNPDVNRQVRSQSSIRYLLTEQNMAN